MAQREHKRLGVTLTDPQQKQPEVEHRERQHMSSVHKRRGPSAPRHTPVYLSLLVDDAVGFLSGDPAVKPQLSYVDDCVGNTFRLRDATTRTGVFIARRLRGLT